MPETLRRGGEAAHGAATLETTERLLILSFTTALPPAWEGTSVALKCYQASGERPPGVVEMKPEITNDKPCLISGRELHMDEVPAGLDEREVQGDVRGRPRAVPGALLSAR